MASLFISYSRKNIEAARKLTEALKGQALDFWIDWEGIPPTVDWWKEIEKGIEEADIFLFLISPDSAKSRVCKQEIEHAVKNGKRLIPVVVRDITGDQVPPELGHLNWIFLRQSDDFSLGFKKIVTAIQTDYQWVQAHRQLQVKALEWERNHRANGFLLHGEELQDAEIQLVANSSKEPHPTDLQREYVLQSRQATDKQRRTTTVIAVVGLIIVATLAVYAFMQAEVARDAQATAESNLAAAQTAQVDAENKEKARGTAQANAEANEKLAGERARIARAGELAAQSVSVRDSQFDLSLLLSIEAFRTADIPRTKSVLLDNVQSNPQLVQYLGHNPDARWRVAFSPDGRTLASGGVDEVVILWDVEAGQPIGQPLLGHEYTITSVVFGPGGKMLASGSTEATVILWNLDPVSLVKKTCERAGRNFTRAEWEKYFPDVEYSKTCDQWPLEPEPVAISGLTP